MEAGPAQSVAKVSSRPAFSKPPFKRPPFPQNIPRSPVLVTMPVPPLPSPMAPIMVLNHMPVHQNPGLVHQNQRLVQNVHSAPQPHRAQAERAAQVQRSAPQGQSSAPKSPAHASRQANRSAGQVHARDNWRKRKEEEADRKVTVTGYPPFTQPQDLLQAFSDYGEVKVERLMPSAALLVFSTPAGATAALRAGQHANIYGEFLKVKPYTKDSDNLFFDKNTRREVQNRQKGPTIDPASIPLSGTFPEQLHALLNAVRLSQHEITQLATLYRDLESVLRGIWPGCRAIPFGSVTTGLGVKSSDADCFMLLPASRGAHANAVSRARRILGQYPRLFSELLAIPRANTPIVKCYHLPTKTHCDLSFKTPLGAQNSKLISFLLHADPRLIPLAVTIKYWAGVHQLTGTGKLTNYALTMLIIFYLQQPPLSILPSVSWLQRDVGSECVVDAWNTGFGEELPPPTDASTIAELLGGFFEFYSHFDFDKLVVCPFLGRPLEKDLFKDLPALPDEFERYKKNVENGATLPIRFNTTMCVQDPFEQCHNVASSVTTHLAADIRAFFKFAADAYNNDKPNGCKNFLKTVLLERPVLPRSKTEPKFRVRLPQKTLALIKDCDWVDKIRNVIFIIFENMLKMKLEKIEAENTDEAEAVENDEDDDNENSTEKETDDANDNDENDKTKEKKGFLKKETETYTGSISRAIWKRKQFSKLYSCMGLKFLEREQKITEELLKVDKNVINVEVNFELSFRRSPRWASLAIRAREGADLDDSNHFKEFGKFYVSVMRKWFTTLCKPYCYKGERAANRVPKPKRQDEKNVTEKEAQKRNLTDELIREGAATDDSDSDSDSSFEDERVDPNAKIIKSDKDSSRSSSQDSLSGTNKSIKARPKETRNLNDKDKTPKHSKGGEDKSNKAVKKQSDSNQPTDDHRS